MFNLRRRSTAPGISPALQLALTRQSAPPGLAPDSLRVLTIPGRYAGRSVRYVRVFDQLAASARDLSIQSFGDLDAYPELIVASGHIEPDGSVMLSGRGTSVEGPVPPRERANREAHQDDEHLLSWDAATSQSAAAQLSEAAASWLQAPPTHASQPTPPLPKLGRDE